VSRAVGHPEWCDDPRYSLEGFVADQQNLVDFGVMTAEAFGGMTMADALAGLLEADVPSGPVLEKSEVLDHPQVAHNEAIVTWEHPTAGTIRSARPGARFLGTPVEMRLSASLKGADNRAVLRELGRTDAEVDRLLADGIIGEPGAS
ncbi:uncharacterized protein METZ01_LOCUS368441, partial [marine metagenome]